MVVYLPDDWETVTPQEDLERRLRRGFKRQNDDPFSHMYEKKRQANIPQELEKALADIVGDDRGAGPLREIPDPT